MQRFYRRFSAGGLPAGRTCGVAGAGFLLTLLLLTICTGLVQANDATGQPDFVTMVRQALAGAGFGDQSPPVNEDGRINFKSPAGDDPKTQGTTSKFALMTIYKTPADASGMFDALAGRIQTDLGNGDKMVIRSISEGNEFDPTPGTRPYPYVSATAYVLCGTTVTTLGVVSYGKIPPENANLNTYYGDAYAALKPGVQKEIEDRTQAVIAAYREAGVCHGGAVKPPQPAGPVRFEIVDANAMFNEGQPIVLNDADKAANPDKDTQARRAISRSLPTRIGAVADGVSLLLIRVPFKEKGVATFTLEGAQAGGDLHPLSPDPFNQKRALQTRLEIPTVQPAPAVGPAQPDAPHWALVFYRPPNDYGGEFANKAQREFKIKVSFEGLVTEIGQTPQPPQEGSETIRLVRPPVVLVHGTYDDPKNCWETGLNYGGYNGLLKDRLRALGFRVTLLNWQETSGAKDPSSFKTNQRVVWNVPGKGGMLDAVTAMRQEGYACTQSDLVCHSQGGVVARVYARGLDSDYRRSRNDVHYTNPQKPHDCYYHRTNNFMQGDINRLLTVSSTHFGSDICRVFNVYMELRDTWGSRFTDIMTQGLLYFGVHMGAGITDGFWDQVPGSGPLQAIGETAIPAHAIACTAADEDLPTIADGYYQDRINKTWNLSSQEILGEAFTRLGQPDNATQLVAMKQEERGVGNPALAALMLPKYTGRMREAVFGNTPNDCTVREESSHGGLQYPYASTIEHVLHGYAPRYERVQSRVIELLQGTGDFKFNENGFPAAGQIPTNKPARPLTDPEPATMPPAIVPPDNAPAPLNPPNPVVPPFIGPVAPGQPPVAPNPVTPPNPVGAPNPVDAPDTPDDTKPKVKQGVPFTYVDPETGQTITGMTIQIPHGEDGPQGKGIPIIEPPAAHTGPTTNKPPTIAPPVAGGSPGGPKIDQVTHDAGGPLGAGDVVRVVIRGAAGMQATCDLPPLFEGMALPEIRPGVYQVTYKIENDDRANNARIVGYLTTPDGKRSFRQADKTISIGGAESNDAGGGTTGVDGNDKATPTTAHAAPVGKPIPVEPATGAGSGNGANTKGPQITQVTHDAHRQLGIGDVARIVVRGTPGQTAFFALPPLVARTRLPETRPSVYQYTYRVQPGDQLQNGQLTGYLTSGEGLEVSRNADEPINIVTPGERPATPPAPGANTPVETPPQEPPPMQAPPGAQIWVREDPIITNGIGEAKWPDYIKPSATGFTVTQEIDGKLYTNTITWELPPATVYTGQRITLTMKATTAPSPYIGASFDIDSCISEREGENGVSNHPNWRANDPHNCALSFNFAPHGDPMIKILGGKAGNEGSQIGSVILTWKYRKK